MFKPFGKRLVGLFIPLSQGIAFDRDYFFVHFFVITLAFVHNKQYIYLFFVQLCIISGVKDVG